MLAQLLLWTSLSHSDGGFWLQSLGECGHFALMPAIQKSQKWEREVPWSYRLILGMWVFGVQGSRFIAGRYTEILEMVTNGYEIVCSCFAPFPDAMGKH